MRLARKLVKTIVVLGVAAAALGGAAALGSTLWDEPPRDAADWAARVAERSVQEQREQDASPAVRRYRLRLNRLCSRAQETVDALERRAARGEDVAALTREFRAEFARFERDFRAIPAPKLLREQAERAADLNAAGLALTDDMIAALRRGDRDAWIAKRSAAQLIDNRFDEVAREIGAGACAVD